MVIYNVYLGERENKIVFELQIQIKSEQKDTNREACESPLFSRFTTVVKYVARVAAASL